MGVEVGSRRRRGRRGASPSVSARADRHGLALAPARRRAGHDPGPGPGGHRRRCRRRTRRRPRPPRRPGPPRRRERSGTAATTLDTIGPTVARLVAGRDAHRDPPPGRAATRASASKSPWWKLRSRRRMRASPGRAPTLQIIPHAGRRRTPAPPVIDAGAAVVHHGGHHPERLRDGPATPRQPVTPPFRRAPGANARSMRRMRCGFRHWASLPGMCARPTPPRRCTSATTASGRSRSPTTTSASRAAGHPGADRGRAPDHLALRRPAARSTTPTPVDLGAGFTPLVRADRLAAELGLGELWIKNDTANPTGSFKDRVVSVALTKARQLGFKVAACASTGNLANSVAAHAARAGMESVVFIPHDLEAAKVDHDRRLRRPRDRRRGHLRRRQPALRRADQRAPGWAFVNVNVRTYYAEGSKTLAFEVAEQLGWQAPDHVVVPIGVGQPADQGGQGLRRARQGRPARRGARTSGSRAPRPRAARRWPPPSPRAPTPSGRSSPHTIAKSLAIGNPADGWYALDVGPHDRAAPAPR